jgi:hypothetical protein
MQKNTTKYNKNIRGVRNNFSRKGCIMQGILYTGGRGWYRMCSHQPTVGLVVSKIKQKFSSAQTATF